MSESVFEKDSRKLRKFERKDFSNGLKGFYYDNITSNIPPTEYKLTQITTTSRIFLNTDFYSFNKFKRWEIKEELTKMSFTDFLVENDLRIFFEKYNLPLKSSINYINIDKNAKQRKKKRGRVEIIFLLEKKNLYPEYSIFHDCRNFKCENETSLTKLNLKDKEKKKKKKNLNIKFLLEYELASN